jgi:hypothetical protein
MSAKRALPPVAPLDLYAWPALKPRGIARADHRRRVSSSLGAGCSDCPAPGKLNPQPTPGGLLVQDKGACRPLNC